MCNEGNAVRLSEITGYIEMLAPLALQESYDNSGLILGDPNILISKVLVCLDADETALDSAARQNCQLVLSHHPAVFNAVKVFTSDRHEGGVLIKSIKHDLALYSAHTNFDSACGGLTDMLCKRLGLNNIKIIRQNISTGGECGIGRYGSIDTISGESFVKMLKTVLLLPGVRLVGSIPEYVSNVAVYNGSYDRDILKDLVMTNSDVLITGDIKYHDARELIENGIFAVDAGHYGTEKIFVEEMASILKNRFPKLTIVRHKGTDAFTFA